MSLVQIQQNEAGQGERNTATLIWPAFIAACLHRGRRGSQYGIATILLKLVRILRDYDETYECIYCEADLRNDMV